MSLRSRRKNLAQSKRSETKWSEAPPWVPPPNENRARFSGRQMFFRNIDMSPAKAGLIFKKDRVPRVPFAALTSPWAILCRLLRRLVGGSYLRSRIVRGYSLLALLLLISIGS